MKNLFLRSKKATALVLIFGLLFLNGSASFVYAAPTPPPAPTAPTTPTSPDAPDAPDAPAAPTPPPAPGSEQEPAETTDSSQDSAQPEQSPSPSSSPYPSSSPALEQSSSQPSGEQTGNQAQDGVSGGDAIIETGDASNNANLITTGNENLSGSGATGTTGSGDITILNEGNGTNSNNSGSVGILNNDLKFQDNSAVVANNLDQITVTGQNSASDNTGANSLISTGDANTTGTIITAVNTNVDGMSVAEFNVNDDHMGDIVLDFDTGCIIGCGGGTVEVANLDNGSFSDNDAALDSITNNLSFQNNEATIENNMTLESNSGDNIASRNTNGDSMIETGDANVSASILTMANNNISGNIIYSVVNIFGNLVGDIIFPESELASSLNCSNCPGDLLAENSGNGSNSTNNTGINKETNDSTYQFNDATIENNLNVDASTGKNSASANTNGDTDIETGNVSVDAQVLNVANSNVAGDWWLVIVNEAGNWVGKIMGAPDGATFAGSAGTDFAVDTNGNITATNSGNGSGSNNDANVSQVENNTTVQTNTANLVNNVNLTANTGGNKATDNTGGYSSVSTGDANVIANMANFVNNNIASGGRLFVTVVNVFGTWTGNFLTPGSGKEQTEQLAQGTASSNPSQPSGDGSGGGNGGTQSTSNQSVSNPAGPSSNSANGTVSNLSPANGEVQPAGINTAVMGAFAQVAGFRTEAEGLDSTGAEGLVASLNVSKKAMKINLAWVLLALPLVAGMFLVKYKSKLSNILPKKRIS